MSGGCGRIPRNLVSKHARDAASATAQWAPERRYLAPIEEQGELQAVAHPDGVTCSCAMPALLSSVEVPG